MRRHGHLLVFAAIIIISCLQWSGSRLHGQASAPDVQTLGPQAGTQAPDFSLTDQHGRRQTLASLAGPNGLMLVFIRSADWCPYCKTQLVELQTRVDDLKTAGIGLAVISYDPVPVLTEFSTRRNITFPLLSDPGSATIKRYGILNTTVPASNPQMRGIPFPGTFMMDAKGVVTSRFFEPSYEERNTAGTILARLGKSLSVSGATTPSAQVDIRTYSSDSTVSPGTRFSLVIDVVPHPRVHVYAPGAKDYIPIALTLQSQPTIVAREVHYPPSEIFYFEPLDEHVPVFHQPFRIVQDVTIASSAAAQATLKNATTLTINGTLNYQACDDTTCFIPQSVPVSWTVTVRPLDLDRSSH